MPETNIGSAVASTDQHTDYSVDTQSLDSASGVKITWKNSKWAQNLGYYKSIPELSSVIDAKATWTVGKGFKADEKTTKLLNTIKGWGKDTFNTILENAVRTYHIAGDFYAEVITTDGKPIRPNGKNLLNLKPLNPGTIVHVVNGQGILARYEQTNQVGKPNQTFAVERIFHLSRNRLADEIHGQSMAEKLAAIILMKNEAMDDWKRVLHRNIDPMMIYHLDTDDTAKIAAFKRKTDAAKGSGENMYIPKDAVVPEQLSIAPNAALNPIPWIESLDAKFYEAASVPKVIVGGVGKSTEGNLKMVYLSFQQTIEEEQLFVEENIKSQLGLDIELEFPASIENELLKDQSKDGAVNVQSNETTAGKGQ